MSATQTQRILEHLQEHGNITQLQAFKLYGITRLGARIYDLKAAGHRIKREIVTSLNRYGDKTHYAVYHLCDNEPILESRKIISDLPVGNAHAKHKHCKTDANAQHMHSKCIPHGKHEQCKRDANEMYVQCKREHVCMKFAKQE